MGRAAPIKPYARNERAGGCGSTDSTVNLAWWPVLCTVLYELVIV